MILRFLRRRIFSLLIGLLILVVLLVAGLTLALDRLVKAGIETVGPRIAQVPLKVKDVDVSVLRGSFAVKGFEMGNPEGFHSPHSFSAGRIRVEAELASLLSDEIVLPLIEVEEPEVTVEFAGTKTNLGEIIKALELSERKQSDKMLRVGLIRIVGAQVVITGLPAGQSIRLPLPDIEIKDVKAGGEPATPGEVAARVLQKLYDRILSGAGEVLPAEQLDALRDELEEVVREGEQILEESLKELEEAADEIRKELEGIFK